MVDSVILHCPFPTWRKAQARFASTRSSILHVGPLVSFRMCSIILLEGPESLAAEKRELGISDGRGRAKRLDRYQYFQPPIR